jgi:muramidase (phage lysozyme)
MSPADQTKIQFAKTTIQVESHPVIKNKQLFKQILTRSLTGLAVLLVLRGCLMPGKNQFSPNSINSNFPPLEMTGGDPYIRALMRTISASESNYQDPYHVIYTGKRIKNLNQHPDDCIPIIAGPNIGKCSTAAGRYQMLSSTWEEMAKRYHPNKHGFLFWQPYSFQPEYQDLVVHNWLSDRNYWKTDISKLLQEGEILRVLEKLSPTWTSLGYGIETNSMSQYLPELYDRFLQEELGKAGAKPVNKTPDAVTIEYFPKHLDRGLVEKALTNIDFPLVKVPSVVSHTATNAIWFGDQVKTEEVKLVAEKLLAAGVQIKAIRPFGERLEFSDYLIQVGADPSLQNDETLSLEQVRNTEVFTRE